MTHDILLYCLREQDSFEEVLQYNRTYSDIFFHITTIYLLK